MRIFTEMAYFAHVLRMFYKSCYILKMTQKGIEPQTPRRDSEILPLHQGYYLPYLTFTYSPSEKWPKKGFHVFENFTIFFRNFFFSQRYQWNLITQVPLKILKWPRRESNPGCLEEIATCYHSTKGLSVIDQVIDIYHTYSPS